jgi:hypothetical protein
MVALALFVTGALIAMTWFDAMVGPLVGGALAITCVFLATRKSSSTQLS